MNPEKYRLTDDICRCPSAVLLGLLTVESASCIAQGLVTQDKLYISSIT